MGDMAEDLMHWEITQELKANTSFFTRSTYPDKVWVTKGGKLVVLRDMKTSHLRNSIAKCKREKWRLEVVPYLEEELERRGEL